MRFFSFSIDCTLSWFITKGYLCLEKSSLQIHKQWFILCILFYTHDQYQMMPLLREGNNNTFLLYTQVFFQGRKSWAWHFMVLCKLRDKRVFEFLLLCCKGHNSLVLSLFINKIRGLKEFHWAWQTLTEHPVCAPGAVVMPAFKDETDIVLALEKSVKCSSIKIHVNRQLLYNLIQDRVPWKQGSVIGRNNSQGCPRPHAQNLSMLPHGKGVQVELKSLIYWL